VARIAGFRIIVIDDRKAFANPDRFPEAEAVHVMPMEGAVDRLGIGRDAYVVVVTRGHQHDEPVIEAAIRTPAAYIGMIGSRRTVALAWERLRGRGATPEQLARVHAPIGLDIGADTPGEIAVSIVAQMIALRRRPPGTSPG
jgi:xanthine dehydrogenase accessory factor